MEIFGGYLELRLMNHQDLQLWGLELDLSHSLCPVHFQITALAIDFETTSLFR